MTAKRRIDRAGKILPALFAGTCMLFSMGIPVSAGEPDSTETAEKVTLRVANWEEYIDEGDWTRKKP